MGMLSRNKGATFEREVAKMIYEHLGLTVKRNLSQYQESGSYDLEGMDDWAIECKRYAHANYGEKRNWWVQAAGAAQGADREPVVIYKLDRSPVRVLVSPFRNIYDPLNYDGVADISFACWCALVRETLD